MVVNNIPFVSVLSSNSMFPINSMLARNDKMVYTSTAEKLSDLHEALIDLYHWASSMPSTVGLGLALR